MGSSDDPVKTGLRFSAELGLIALGTAVLVAFILLPRASVPVAWPMPHVDFRALRAEAQRSEVRRAERAGRPLSRPLLRVGERLRRLGAALYRGELPQRLELGYRREAFDRASEALLESVGRLKPTDREEWLELCALQSELFVSAVQLWQSEGLVSRDLLELGGDFSAAAGPAWQDEQGRLPFAAGELALLFRVRFAQLTETDAHPEFKPSRDEFLAYYGLLLAHPPRDRAQAAATRHGAVIAISALDPSYPTALAHGLADLERGLFDQAAASLLDAPETGSWAKLRQNALLEAKRRGTE